MDRKGQEEQAAHAKHDALGDARSEDPAAQHREAGAARVADDAAQGHPQRLLRCCHRYGSYLGAVAPLGHEGERQRLQRRGLALAAPLLLGAAVLQGLLHLLELLARPGPLALADHVGGLEEQLGAEVDEEPHGGPVRVLPREQGGQDHPDARAEDGHRGERADGAQEDPTTLFSHRQKCCNEEGLVAQLRDDDHREAVAERLPSGGALAVDAVRGGSVHGLAGRGAQRGQQQRAARHEGCAWPKATW
mmetsp:Transcript_41525/g.120170  ORF Transcript_41525/g.120170 Transcript_41525/m.120170 type:complete len:248 (+) Transcript_41525:290-1033(+)